MTDYCKHGVDLARTCRKCGRIMVVEAPEFAAKKLGFTSSIGRLEETVRQMNAELARPVSSAPPVWATPAKPEPARSDDDDDDNPPPPPPVERFPWQRR
jgi:hypothetical protein